MNNMNRWMWAGLIIWSLFMLHACASGQLPPDFMGGYGIDSGRY